MNETKLKSGLCHFWGCCEKCIVEMPEDGDEVEEQSELCQFHQTMVLIFIMPILWHSF